MNTVLEVDEGSASRPGRSLPPGKTRRPLYRRLGGPQGRSGRVRKISLPPGFFCLNDTFVGLHVSKYNVTVLFDDVSVFFPTSLQVVLCMSVWSVLQYQTYVLRRFGVFPCGSAVSLLFSIAPRGGGVATIICPDSFLLLSVSVECGMPSGERASYSPHS